MSRNVTHDDLILFAYNETEDERSAEILEALGKDKELLDEFNSITDFQAALSAPQKGPSEETMSRILGFANALNVFKLKPAVNTCYVVVN